MKLDTLYEYVDLVSSSCDMYCDPKGKAKKLNPPKNDMSPLVGGKKDRNRFLKKMQPVKEPK